MNRRPDPRLAGFDAVLFDLDGVLTPTAEVHMHAWQTMFDELFAAWSISPPYTDDDYYTYVDGKKRYDGVAGLLRSRDVEVPWGTPMDDPSESTVCGIGNRKNDVFMRVLARDGIAPYDGSLALMAALEATQMPVAVVSSSKNARPVLDAAGIRDRFRVVVDGVVAEERHLPSKPAPDVFLEGARGTRRRPRANRRHRRRPRGRRGRRRGRVRPRDRRRPGRGARSAARRRSRPYCH